MLFLSFCRSSLHRSNDQTSIGLRSHLNSPALFLLCAHTYRDIHQPSQGARCRPLPRPSLHWERRPQPLSPRRAAAWQSILRRRSHNFSSRFRTKTYVGKTRSHAFSVSHRLISQDVHSFSLAGLRLRSRTSREPAADSESAGAEKHSRADRLRSMVQRCATAAICVIDEASLLYLDLD